MNKERVIEAVKFIKDSCATTSCFDCCFADKENVSCILSDEFSGAISEIDIELLEECKNEYCSD